MTDDRRERFHRLHDDGTFVLPNPWDVGSARLLAWLGFPALATTSSGHAATLGRRDQQVRRDELLAHAAVLADAVELPVSVDAERGFPDEPGGVAETVRLIASTGAAGCSIEDYDPVTGRIAPLDDAVGAVEVAARAARAHGLVLTARAENHLYGIDDLDDTVARLQAYRHAGAHVLYAPGLVSLDDIARVVRDVAAPVNVLARPDGPPVAELAAVGVRRVSTGGALHRAAYGTFVAVARELLVSGTSTRAAGAISADDLAAAFAARPS
ncbi:MAG TPA: isocitrate lyase/phosphoenolpyruvate mutase family protein [Euzebyales bacterium]|nr:isocitrate lyase/phosphoenolpyruvate mutase family protein [Euzebyales bacterium]